MIFSWMSFDGSLSRISDCSGVPSAKLERNFERSSVLGKGARDSIDGREPSNKLESIFEIF